MKVFISMPMKDKSKEEVKEEMAKAFEFIKSKAPSAEFIDSIIDGADKELEAKGDAIGILYLGESIKKMAEADVVFFVNKWRDYRGCFLEREVAEAYGKFCVDITVD